MVTPQFYSRSGVALPSDSATNRLYESLPAHLKNVNITPNRSRELIHENKRLSRMAEEAPRVPWDIFTRDILDWKNGEHVGMIGPTGQGKTTMLINVLPFHPYVVVFGTKPRDDTMNYLELRGYLKMDRWKSIDPVEHPRRILWPDATKMNSGADQRKVFRNAFSKIYREGGWTVALDETWYIINTLKLDHAVKMFLLQARSLGISLIAATQRPAYIPLEVYDQSTHLFFWRDNDERNLSRISGLSVQSSGLIRSIVSSLDPHQVLYVNTRTGVMVRTHSPKIEGI